MSFTFEYRRRDMLVYIQTITSLARSWQAQGIWEGSGKRPTTCSNSFQVFGGVWMPLGLFGGDLLAFLGSSRRNSSTGTDKPHNGKPDFVGSG